MLRRRMRRRLWWRLLRRLQPTTWRQLQRMLWWLLLQLLQRKLIGCLRGVQQLNQ
jgi:hypothetical protein